MLMATMTMSPAVRPHSEKLDVVGEGSGEGGGEGSGEGDSGGAAASAEVLRGTGCSFSFSASTSSSAGENCVLLLPSSGGGMPARALV